MIDVSKKGDLQRKDRARKRSEFLGRTAAANSLFVSVYGGGNAVQAYTHGGIKKRMRFDEAKAVEVAALKWKISCYALCRDSNGRDYIKSMCLMMQNPVKQSEINKFLSQAHFDWMQEECNMNHVLTLAWIATTGPEPSDDVAMRIFVGTGIFEQLEPVTAVDDGVFTTNPKVAA